MHDEWMNEWMFNDTPAQKNNNRFTTGCQKKVNAWNGYIIKNWKNIVKHSVKSCAINKISQLGLFKMYSKIQFVLKTTQLLWGGI